MRAGTVLSIIVTTILLASTAEAVVLCAKPRRDGTYNTSVKIREVCKDTETQLEPAALGLQGPPGPQGEPGESLPLFPTIKAGDPDCSGCNGVELNAYSYYMDTLEVSDQYIFGQARLETTGVPGQFKLCAWPGTGGFSYVVYINGVRSTGVLAEYTYNCSGTFDVGAHGDFQVNIRRAVVFGVNSGDIGGGAYNYNLVGFSQLFP